MGKLFDEVLYNAKNAADAARKKASEVIDYSKLKFSATDINKKISALYETIGKATYKDHNEGTDSLEEINECIVKIDNLNVELESVYEQMAYVKNKSKEGKCKCSKDTFCCNSASSEENKECKEDCKDNCEK